MRSPIAIAAFVLFACGLGAADEKKDEPKKYESKEGKYAVAFPGKPEVSTKKAGAEEWNMAVVKTEAGAYLVIHSDLPAESLKAAKPKEILAEAEKAFMNSFKANVTSSKEVEFGKKKYPAREAVAEKDATQLRITLVLADNRLYQVFVVGPKDLVGGKEADEFFKSFEVTK
jgi:hypothetical protein